MIVESFVAGAAAVPVAYLVGGHVVGWATSLKRRLDRLECVALTFDDGPMDTTPAILECLAEHQAPATFFMVGRRAAAQPGLAREVAARGHEIGNHTFSHVHLWTLDPWRTAAEIERGSTAIAEATGTQPIAFRPPWGIFNAAVGPVLRRLGQPAVLWSVRSEGLVWKPTPEAMAAHMVRCTRGGDVLNLHDAGGFPDTPARVLAALPLLITGLREAGFRLVPLSGLL